MQWNWIAALVVAASLVACGAPGPREDRPAKPGTERPWPDGASNERAFLDGLVKRFVHAKALDIEGTLERKEGKAEPVMGAGQAHVLRPRRGYVQLNVGDTFTEQLGDGKAIYFLDHDRQTYRRTEHTTWRGVLPELYLCGVWCDPENRDPVQDVKLDQEAGRTRIALTFADRIETLELNEQQRIVRARIERTNGDWVRFAFTRFDLVVRPDPSRYRSSVPDNYRPAGPK